MWKKYLQASWCCNMVGLLLAQSVTFWASVEQQTGLKNTSRQHIVSLTWGQRTRRLSGGRCVNPLGTRLCCDVESTSLTLIQRRNNVCAQWKISTGWCSIIKVVIDVDATSQQRCVPSGKGPGERCIHADAASTYPTAGHLISGSDA